jgi:hypothetical protein
MPNKLTFLNTITPFCKRFEKNRNPDLNDKMLSEAKGEFSLDTELLFENYLSRLRRMTGKA